MTEQPPASAIPPSQPPTLAARGVEDPAWSRMGRWDPVFELPNVAIHTHLLPNGTVLFWGSGVLTSADTSKSRSPPPLIPPSAAPQVRPPAELGSHVAMRICFQACWTPVPAG